MSTKFIIGWLPALALVLTLAACDQQGPAERTGEGIDNAAEELADEAEDMFEEANNKAEETQEATSDALEEAEDKAEKCVEFGLTEC